MTEYDNMKIIDKLRYARDFAKKKHAGQLDDDMKDYYESHLTKVFAIIQTITDDIDIIVASLLHDCIEDQGVSVDELSQTFNSRIANLVNEVTHEGKPDHYGYYFPRLQSKEAIMIKFADRLSNISRMNNWSRTRQQQYLNNSIFWRDGSNINGE